ncbi:MAG: AGE family epimerase/isomerase [Pseudomonadota bacterium]
MKAASRTLNDVARLRHVFCYASWKFLLDLTESEAIGLHSRNSRGSSEHMTGTIFPTILCGGSGTRLWPLSTKRRPKQFLPLTTSKTMVHETADRFSGSNRDDLNFGRPLAIGSNRHAALLAESLPGARLILEPFGRNSAPAVAAACLAHQADDLVLILAADHDIKDVPAFHDAIASALPAAQDGAIVTFGITPTYPATGYGYIHAADPNGTVSDVRAFVEKPPLETAEAYIADGSYFWNAGIFLFKVSTMLAELETRDPGLVDAVRASMPDPKADIVNLDPTAFIKATDISIDFAVMEHAENVKTVPVSMGWSDVGGYPALHELAAGCHSENVVSGPVFHEKSSGLLVRSEGPRVAVSGLKDITVIATPDVVMVSDSKDLNAVKRLGKEVIAKTDSLHISDAYKVRAKAFLWSAFETWSKSAWDETQSGFVEQLDMAGNPDRNALRRLRVQARQTYSFAKGISLGWPEADRAADLVDKGLNYLNTYGRHPGGGWVHHLNSDGSIANDTRDLYDHAFVILGGAAAYQATGSQMALDMALETLTHIQSNYADADHGGWFEGHPKTDQRRANPHMHMLEAMLELYAATKDEAHLALATEIVELFESRLFKPSHDALVEFFDLDWGLSTPVGQTIIEPGHHYEWAVLLAFHERLTGRDTGSWQRRLITRADQIGRDARTGFAWNALRADGSEITNDKRRLWPQLEMLRARQVHPQLAAPGAAERLIDAIEATYLTDMPVGTWLDQTDRDGAPISTAVPSSMLYHFITAYGPLIDPET